MAEQLLVEIIAHAPTAYYYCKHCEFAWSQTGVSDFGRHEQMQSSLPPDLTREYQMLSDWVQELFRRYCDRVAVHVIDAASFEGIVNSLRYGARRYPAVIVGRQARFTGQAADVFKAAGEEVARRLGEPAQPGVKGQTSLRDASQSNVIGSSMQERDQSDPS